MVNNNGNNYVKFNAEIILPGEYYKSDFFNYFSSRTTIYNKKNNNI